MLEEMIIIKCVPQTCIIERDNCSSKNRPAQYFDNFQHIWNKTGVPMVWLFSLAEHGKGKVDHNGGPAKCFICRNLGTKGEFLNASQSNN